ncbi:LOW QUALITY PROTEIN: hypothetical protein ElyMa_000204000 [Elysia marginata]|uniref:Uncharacterized protein n=1 Tax=Elysia marginata TaxID=1093978 RepID=A0AAV4EY34_9GAST|nr:LOW QUALITY PROTEIN: hypothetical protein ElyMa_000204000 [Elysia marginata]
MKMMMMMMNDDDDDNDDEDDDDEDDDDVQQVAWQNFCSLSDKSLTSVNSDRASGADEAATLADDNWSHVTSRARGTPGKDFTVKGR